MPLARLFHTYRWRILATYGLLNVENLLGLARPFVLGLAVNDLLRGSRFGLVMFGAQHAGQTLLGVLRRAYDTRAFTAIYVNLATEVVTRQRARKIEISQVAMRSVLARELVDFYERDVPLLLQMVYSVAGGLALLGLYDPLLIVLCLAVVVPAGVLNVAYGRRAFRLNRGLNDELEREIQVIGGEPPDRVHLHFQAVAQWRIHLSDAEAINFGLTEAFVLALLAVTLVRLGQRPGISAGDVLAAFQYVWIFIRGLDGLPFLVQQIGRLRDIRGRM